MFLAILPLAGWRVKVNWHPVEVAQADRLAQDMERYRIARRVCPPATLYFRESDLSELLHNLYMPVRGKFWPRGLLGHLPLRQLYKALGFVESHPFRWHLEHKLVQALVIRRYCDGVYPVTLGLRRFAHQQSQSGDQEAIYDLLRRLYVKRSLGYGGSSVNDEATREAWQSLEGSFDCSGISQEQWVVQERISIEEEYRVHTIEDAVVDDATYVRHTPRLAREDRHHPNSFVTEVVRALPDAFLANSVCGWDVARTAAGFKIVEVNFAGLYTAVCPGFQGSAFFAAPIWER
jgi:hypothetical protein